MSVSRILLPRLALLGTLIALLMLSACSSSASTEANLPNHPTTQPIILPTATATVAPTITLTPPSCGSQFGATFQATLPDATSTVTSVYADVLLPPETRSYDDDATGLRARFMCSAGTATSVLSFMTDHLTQQGWTTVTTVSSCGRAVIPNYGMLQCWETGGKYFLFVGINSNTDWVAAFIDPAFLT
jgi:hypothetical protein